MGTPPRTRRIEQGCPQECASAFQAPARHLSLARGCPDLTKSRSLCAWHELRWPEGVWPCRNDWLSLSGMSSAVSRVPGVSFVTFLPHTPRGARQPVVGGGSPRIAASPCTVSPLRGRQAIPRALVTAPLRGLWPILGAGIPGFRGLQSDGHDTAGSGPCHTRGRHASNKTDDPACHGLDSPGPVFYTWPRGRYTL